MLKLYIHASNLFKPLISFVDIALTFLLLAGADGCDTCECSECSWLRADGQFSLWVTHGVVQSLKCTALHKLASQLQLELLQSSVLHAVDPLPLDMRYLPNGLRMSCPPSLLEPSAGLITGWRKVGFERLMIQLEKCLFCIHFTFPRLASLTLLRILKCAHERTPRPSGYC